jgi:hypothetical protein
MHAALVAATSFFALSFDAKRIEPLRFASEKLAQKHSTRNNHAIIIMILDTLFYDDEMLQH